MRFFWLGFACMFWMTQALVIGNCDDQADETLQKAIDAWQQEQWDLAVEAFQASVKLPCVQKNHYDYHEILFILARLEMKRDKADQAIDYLAKAADAGFTGRERLESQEEFEALKQHPLFSDIQKAYAQNDRTLLVTYDDVLKTPYQEHLSQEEKVAGLSMFWAEAKYNFAFFDQTQVNWDKVYLETIPKVLAAKTTAAYYEVLATMCTTLADGHSNIFLPKALHAQYYARPEFRTDLIEDKILVVAIENPELQDNQFQVGCEVVAIDGIPAKKYAQEHVSPFMLTASTPQDLRSRRYYRGLLAGDAKEKVTIQFKTAKGIVFERRFQRQLKHPQLPTLKFEALGEIGYAQINSFADSSLFDSWLEHLPEIQKTKGLVIDLRKNGGGNTPTWLMRQLAKAPFQSNTYRTRMHVASHSAWGNGSVWYEGGGEQIQPDTEHPYAGPVVLLVGPQTFSAAEDFASTLKAMKRVTLLGEATGGSTGQPLFIKLPGGGSARVCTKRDRTFDGGEFVGIGVIPDQVITRTVADIRTGKDPVLDTAIQKLKAIAKAGK